MENDFIRSNALINRINKNNYPSLPVAKINDYLLPIVDGVAGYKCYELNCFYKLLPDNFINNLLSREPLHTATIDNSCYIGDNHNKKLYAVNYTNNLLVNPENCIVFVQKKYVDVLKNIKSLTVKANNYVVAFFDGNNELISIIMCYRCKG